MDVLSNAEKESYGTLQERHIKDYLSYYEKSNLKLNYKDSYEHLTKMCIRDRHWISIQQNISLNQSVMKKKCMK